MATLDSSSDFDAVVAEYQDTASYEEAGSVALARRFLTACRHLLLLLPKRTAHANRAEEIEFDPTRLSEEMKSARRFIAANPTSTQAARTTFCDFRNFRD